MFLTIVLLSALAQTPMDSQPLGHLLIIGGGGTTEDMQQRALALAGGPKAKVLIIPQASGDLEGALSLVDWWRKIGANDIRLLDLDDPEAAREAIRSADLFWMRGGSQTRLFDALSKGGVLGEIRKRYQEGAVVCGTSAGAAVMSSVMIAGSEGRRGTPAADTPKMGAGLGLWPDVIVDQHFLQRKRINRLRRAVKDHPNLIGVGIDEKTAVLVNGREFEVLGVSDVIVLDSRKEHPARSADEPQPGAAARDDNPEDSHIVVHELKPGMKYHLDKGFLAPMSKAVGTGN